MTESARFDPETVIFESPMNTPKLTRRHFSSLLVASPALLKGQRTSSQAARIKVDTERVIGEIDPKMYGNFIEHLGRCIRGRHLR